MAKRDAQDRFTECEIKGASSNVGFLGVDRPIIASHRFWLALIAVALVVWAAANTEIG